MRELLREMKRHLRDINTKKKRDINLRCGLCLNPDLNKPFETTEN